MSVKGEIKEGASFIKEEMNEHGKTPEAQRKAEEGRDLRNEGRVEDGKDPKTTKPGAGHPEKEFDDAVSGHTEAAFARRDK